MLLSQSCQAQLGITKNMRTGKITLDDYEGQKLLVARQSGTGLFMIRIDHLFMYQYMRHAKLKRLVLPDLSDEENDDDSYEDAKSDSPENRIGFPAGEEGVDLLPANFPFPHNETNANKLIVTCGLDNFETVPHSRDATRSVQNYCWV